jgi:hypothetical protein
MLSVEKMNLQTFDACRKRDGFRRPAAEDSDFLSRAIRRSQSENRNQLNEACDGRTSRNLLGNQDGGRQLSYNEVSLKMLEYDIDIHSDDDHPTATATTDVSFGDEVSELDSPLVLEVKQLSGKNIVDPRNKLCAFWDAVEETWKVSGVVVMGVSTNSSAGPAFLCGSTHLTSFTANKDLLPPNLKVLYTSPSVLKNYELRTAYVAYFVCSFLLLSFIKLRLVSKSQNQPDVQYNIWKAAAVNYLHFGSIDATDKIIPLLPNTWSAVKYRCKLSKCS